MHIMQTITDYLRNTIMTTQGDLLVRGAAVAERLAAVAVNQVLKSGGVGVKPAWAKALLSDQGFEIGDAVISTSGSEYITGLPFSPLLILLLASDNAIASKCFSWGWDDATLHRCVSLYDDGASIGRSATDSFFMRRGVGDQVSGYVSAMVSDGFTLTHTMAGGAIARVDWLAIG